MNCELPRVTAIGIVPRKVNQISNTDILVMRDVMAVLLEWAAMYP